MNKSLSVRRASPFRKIRGCILRKSEQIIVSCCGAIFIGLANGCVNLSKDLVLPVSMLNQEPPAKADKATKAPQMEKIEAEKIPGPAAIFVRGSERTSDKALLGVPVPMHYGGLEILNRAAGNGPDSDPILKSVKNVNEISYFVRKLATRTDDGKTSTRHVIIHYLDVNEPLSRKFLQDANVKRALEATRQDISRTSQSSKSIRILSAKALAKNLTRAVTTLHSDPTRQGDMLSSLQSIQKAATNSTSSTKTINVRLDSIAFAYMQAYLEGKFVDRSGTTISKPEIAEKIGNDTITSFEKVLLEAVYDYATMTPVVYQKRAQGGAESTVSANKAPAPSSKGNTATEGSKTNSAAKPTFAVLFPDFYEEVSTNTDNVGITAAELKFMTFLSGIGSEQSKHLSAVITRFIGGASFVGKLSIGDNDTLSKVVSTFCDSFVGGVVDTVNYDFFERFQYAVKDGEYTANESANSTNLHLPPATGTAIVKALQYEDLLSSLLSGSSSQSSK